MTAFRLWFAVPVLRAIAFVCLVYAALAPNNAEARVYKCTDAQGNLYYTDTACPADSQREVVPIEEPATPVHSGTVSEDPQQKPYSVTEEPRPVAPRRTESNEENAGQQAAGGLRDDDRRKLDEIASELRSLDIQELELKDTLRKNVSSARKRFAREDLEKIAIKRNDLNIQRTHILGYVPADVRQRELVEEQARLKRQQQSEQNRKRAEEDMERMHAEDRKRHEVEETYRREKRFQEIGIIGREGQFNRASEACEFTPGAVCR